VGGRDNSNISHLFALSAQGRSRVQTAYTAAVLLYNCRQNFAKPFCWFLLITGLAGLADPKGRTVLLWMLAPVMLLWAMFFSYEVRTVSLAFPFLAYCSGAGSGVLVRPLERLWLKRKPARVASFLLAAACLLVLFAALYFEKVRTALTAGWRPPYMSEIRSIWAISLLAAAVLLCVVVAIAARRQFALKINWYYALPLVAWIWFGTATARTADIVARQIELQKDIESPSLNRAIYAVYDKEGLRGKVATDYWIFGRLPVLKKYYFPRYYPPSTSVEYLKAVGREAGVCYLLVDESRLSAPAVEALAQGLFRTVLIDSRRRLIETCGNPAERK
jgi:hypothetical protein